MVLWVLWHIMVACFLLSVYSWLLKNDGAFQVALVAKNLSASVGDMRCGLDPWVRKIPWRRTWRPTLVFLPRESHGQRNLVNYSP